LTVDVGAGFVIEILNEGVPDAESVEDHPRLDRQTRIPWYLHLRARRVKRSRQLCTA
jgi:hypothetical protein